MNFTIRGLCITLRDAFLYTDFKQYIIIWIGRPKDYSLLVYTIWICGLKTHNISKQFLFNYLTPDKGCIIKS